MNVTDCILILFVLVFYSIVIVGLYRDGKKPKKPERELGETWTDENGVKWTVTEKHKTTWG